MDGGESRAAGRDNARAVVKEHSRKSREPQGEDITALIFILLLLGQHGAPTKKHLLVVGSEAVVVPVSPPLNLTRCARLVGTGCSTGERPTIIRCGEAFCTAGLGVKNEGQDKRAASFEEVDFDFSKYPERAQLWFQ